MKKAQIKMSETIAVLFVFFVLVIFGVLFYFNYSKIAIKEKNDELLGRRAMEVTLQTLFLPELICSRGKAEPIDNCFDLMKLRQVNNTFRKYFSDYYYNLFPYTKISVDEFYPGNRSWVLYNKPKTKKSGNSTIPTWTRLENTYFVVSLKDETRDVRTGIYSLGILTVGVYS